MQVVLTQWEGVSLIVAAASGLIVRAVGAYSENDDKRPMRLRR
jgi:hypothetical protein